MARKKITAMYAGTDRRDENEACPVCGTTEVEIVSVNYPFFTHLHYTTLKPDGAIGRCRSCQTLCQVFAEQDVHAMQALLGTEDYAQSQQTNQTFTVAEFTTPVTRSFLQAVLIARAVSKANPAVLDIGAFDGQLLVELQSRLPGAKLHAFDVNPHLGAFYAAKPDIRFWSPDLAAVEGVFDVICMSHSMMYERNTQWLMQQIKRLLRADGLLYIQVPDITANPCYILMGDQYYYYTADILKNTLQRFGFSFTRLQTDWFPREVAGVARRGDANHGGFTIDRHIYHCLKDLDGKAAKLRSFASRSRLGVLGTTANAAFADSLLAGRVYAFFDENPHRVGALFRGKRVLDPRSLLPSDVLVVPYGASGERIRERFCRHYPCEFVVV